MKKTVENTGPYENPYDALSRAERAEVYYSKEKRGRKDERDYAESIARLLPVVKGSTPITQEDMRKLFRGKTGKQKREERAAKKAATEAAARAENKT